MSRPIVDLIEEAVTEAINGVSRTFDSSVYVEWLCTKGDTREPSTKFGQISTDEMLMLLAQPETSPQSCKDIGDEIRRRFTDTFLEGITEAAQKKAKQEADDAEEALLRAPYGSVRMNDFTAADYALFFVFVLAMAVIALTAGVPAP